MREFKALSKIKPELMYKVLKKAVRPTYSGAIDHRLNLLDI
jgi:hypothetical protein